MIYYPQWKRGVIIAINKNKIFKVLTYTCLSCIVALGLLSIAGCGGSGDDDEVVVEESQDYLDQDDCYYEEVDSNVTSDLVSHGPLKRVSLLAEYYDLRLHLRLGGSSEITSCDTPEYADGFYLSIIFSSDDFDSNGFPMESRYDNVDVEYMFGPGGGSGDATIEFVDTIPQAVGDSIKITVDATFDDGHYLRTNTYLESVVIIPN